MYHFDPNYLLVYEDGTLSQTRAVCEVIFFGTSSKVNQVIYKSTHHLFSAYQVSMPVALKPYEIFYLQGMCDGRIDKPKAICTT